MRTFIDFDDAPVVTIAVVGDAAYEGMLIEGPQGWGEFGPPAGCDGAALARWLTAAIEPGTVGWPDPVRGRVPVSVSVPAIDPAAMHRMVAESGCRCADVVVGQADLVDDVARCEAAQDALGPSGVVRLDAGGRWGVEAAVGAVSAIARVASVEYVRHPCACPDDTAAVRRRVGVPVAVDASQVRSLAGVADIAVLRSGPLGGVRRALRVAEATGVPCVVVAPPQTTIGLAGSVALAGALPELPFACALGVLPSMSGDVVADARSLHPADGYLPVAPMPPAPEPALISRFAQADESRVRWWRQRLDAARTVGKPES